MNSYVGMTTVKKEQRQHCFSQHTSHITSLHKSSDNQYSTYVGWQKYALLTEIILFLWVGTLKLH